MAKGVKKPKAPAWPADHVEHRLIEKLIPYARNPRTHSAEQIAQIAASMREWGWTMPVLVDEGGTIIAGHGRILAARQLGFTEAPCLVARGWSEAKKRAYVIADNKLAENAGWNEEALAAEMADLLESGFDMSLTGFEPHEIEDLSKGWDFDAGEVERHEENLDGIITRINLLCSPEQKERLLAALRRVAVDLGGDIEIKA